MLDGFLAGAQAVRTRIWVDPIAQIHPRALAHSTNPQIGRELGRLDHGPGEKSLLPDGSLAVSIPTLLSASGRPPAAGTIRMLYSPSGSRERSTASQRSLSGVSGIGPLCHTTCLLASRISNRPGCGGIVDSTLRTSRT